MRTLFAVSLVSIMVELRGGQAGCEGIVKAASTLKFLDLCGVLFKAILTPYGEDDAVFCNPVGSGVSDNVHYFPFFQDCAQ
jgi:hypothetical protein